LSDLALSKENIQILKDLSNTKIDIILKGAKEKGWNLKCLSEKADVSYIILRRWKNGRRVPKMDWIIRVYKAVYGEQSVQVPTIQDVLAEAQRQHIKLIDLTRMSGIKYNSLLCWKNGVRKPKVENILTLCKALEENAKKNDDSKA
jgi:lambda repressor-like predicted transcriptional regulator